jgi:hypothetical protein
MILARSSIGTFAANAGFEGTDLETAKAIAFAESSGDPENYDPEQAFFLEHGIEAEKAQGQGSVGLWQIFRWEHPEFRAWNLKDPQVNACAAFLIYKDAGDSFKPWDTWLTGEYRKFLAPPAAPASAAPEPGGVL